MTNDERNEALLKNIYDGDRELMEADMERGRREIIHWKDIMLAEKTFPELEELALEHIKFLLGYLPPKHFTLPHEPFIRTMLNDRKHNKINADEMYEQSEIHAKAIRNEVLGDNRQPALPKITQRKYNDYLPEFKLMVKERLTRFMGYEPKPEHSTVAEIFLREAMASDQFVFMEKLSTTDMQAINLIRYREVLLAEGRQAADNSPLVALDIYALNSLSKIDR